MTDTYQSTDTFKYIIKVGNSTPYDTSYGTDDYNIDHGVISFESKCVLMADVKKTLEQSILFFVIPATFWQAHKEKVVTTAFTISEASGEQ
jgi:hypothetical protein